jgi:hypothetical protein
MSQTKPAKRTNWVILGVLAVVVALFVFYGLRATGMI